MTCIIQLGTYDRIYLVDPFPVFDSIKQDLKEVLENPKILKIMSGMDNDVLAFQRDFEIYLNGAIDAAQLQTELFRNSFEMLKEARTTDFKNVDRNEILYRCCHKNGSLLSQQEIDTKCTKKSSLKDMAKWYFPKYPEPEDATLADWRLRPIMGRMQEYAVFDVYVLLHIWSWMKRLVSFMLSKYPSGWIKNICFCTYSYRFYTFCLFQVKLQANTNEMLQRTVETDKKLLLKTYRTPTRLTLQEQLRKGNVPPVDRVRLNLVYNYVQLRAKIVDESPNELVTVADMAVLIQRAETQRITPEEIVQLVAARRRIPSETIEDTSQSLARVLNEGETFIESTHRAVCHACNGTFDYPHVAWMCCKIGTYQDQKEFLNRPEQKEAKHRRYQRNKEKYMAKYPDKPFPPLSQ